MMKDEMLQRLEEHHRDIRALLDKIRGHCGFPRPSSDELDADRTALRKSSLARSAFISDEVVPALLVDADADLRHDLAEMLASFTAKRQVSDAHIMRWTYATIEQDWDGYCGAARRIWAIMEEQLDDEWRVLAPRLGDG